MESPRLTIRLHAVLMQRLNDAAKRTGRTRTAIVARAVSAELDIVEAELDDQPS